MEIPQDKAKEYMQVAALLAMDIDVLYDISQLKDLDADKLRKQIAYLHKMKEELITDSKIREMRYNAVSLLFSLTGAK